MGRNTTNFLAKKMHARDTLLFLAVYISSSNELCVTCLIFFAVCFFSHEKKIKYSHNRKNFVSLCAYVLCIRARDTNFFRTFFYTIPQKNLSTFFFYYVLFQQQKKYSFPTRQKALYPLRVFFFR